MLRPSHRFARCCLLLAALGACSTPPAPEGLLAGNPDDPASGAYVDLWAEDRTTADEVTVDVDGTAYDRTNLSIAYTAEATVGQVNELITSVGGSIVSMLPGVYITLVRIPDPGDLAGLQAVEDQLRDSPIVRRVTRARVARPTSLPGNYPPSSALSPIDHHIAVLAPAAWNAKRALQHPSAKAPYLVVQDFFGGGLPGSDFDLVGGNLSSVGTGTPSPTGHGYHVLGIITGRHNTDPAAATGPELVTGMYPGTLDVALGDATLLNTAVLDDWMVRVLLAGSQNGDRVVFNTSLGYAALETQLPPAVLALQANEWLEKLRGTLHFLLGEENPGTEGNLVHLTSAGNFQGAGDGFRADIASGFASASLLPGLQTVFGTPVPNTRSTLVVENRWNWTAPLPILPGCESATSKLGGHVAGIGEDVWSLTASRGAAGNLTGTSMSTPQVAGLVAYIWALNPALSPGQVIGIVEDTSAYTQDEASCSGSLAPVIDAYAAVLAAVDSPDALTASPADAPSLAPVRTAILDVDDSGTFDEADVELYAAALLGPAAEAQDFSRLDLNGDGYTGGARTARFNLDLDPEGTYGAVSQEALNLELDESSVTDTEILCFYAFSPLYGGDGQARDDALASACKPASIFFHQYDIDVGIPSIFSMDADGSNVVRLVDGSAVDCELPRASADGQRVVFSGQATDSFDLPDVHTVAADGTGLANLTQSPGTDDLDPVWSPDGAQIAFYRRNTAQAGVYVMNGDGGELHQVAPGNGRPYWSPDGLRLLFARRSGSGPSAVFTLHTIGADGTGERLLATADESISDYQWSPDGSKILFVQADGLFVIDPDGANRQLLREGIAFYRAFAWSPDSSRIAFAAPGPTGDDDIFVMNADGTGATNITNTPGHNYAPQWSDAGLVFLSYRDENQEIYRTSLDGTDQRNLTNTPLWEDLDR